MEHLVQGNRHAKEIGRRALARLQEEGHEYGDWDERKHFPEWTIEQVLGSHEVEAWCEVEADGKVWFLLLVRQAVYFCRFDEPGRAEVKFSGPLAGAAYAETFRFSENEELEVELTAVHPRIPGRSLKMSFRPDRPRENESRLREQLREWSGSPRPPSEILASFE
jgi:hypothetical protein